MTPRFLRAAWYRSDMYGRSLRRRPPAQMFRIATDPLPDDPGHGADLVAGTFVLAARRRALGAEPFAAPPPGWRARADLHGFRWLADLAALAGNDARMTATGLVQDWLRHCDRWDAVAWDSGVLAARLLAWINHVDFVTEGVGSGLNAAMAASAAAQARHLARVAPVSAADAAPFAAAAALIASSRAMSGLEALREAGLKRLEGAVAADILADGGHRSRVPQVQFDSLARLIEAREGLRAGREEAPAFIGETIQRVAAALKSVTLGDGGLADFNGGLAVSAAAVGAALRAAGAAKTTPPASLRQWGFERLQAGTTIVVADAGNGGAHAGALSFEMSAGRHRIVVNCGAHPDETTEWSQVLRVTAAHSTLAVNDTDALPPDPGQRAAVGVASRRNEREGSSLVQLSHEGYRPAFGVVHNRDLYLSRAGDDFRGRDTLVGGAGAFSIRFHLHPDVQASALGGGASVLLKLPGGRGWRFRSSGAELALEESVYLGDPERPRRTQQIVLRGATTGGETDVRWSFLREGA